MLASITRLDFIRRAALGTPTTLPTLGVAGYCCVGLALWFDLPLPFKAVGLLVAFAISIVSPVAAIAAVLVAAPFIFDPVSFFGQQFSLLELGILVGCAGIGVNALSEMVKHRSYIDLNRMVRPWPMTVGIFLLLLAASVSLVTLADPQYRPESLREFRLVIVEPLIFFAACRWVFSDHHARRFASLALVGVGAAVGAFAVGQILIGSDGVVADGVRRATGPYPHPNNLALFLERAGLLGAGYALTSRGDDRWVGAGSAIALIGAGMTFSRGAALGVFIGLILVLLALRRVRGVWVIGLGSVVVVGILLLTVGDRVLATGSTGAGSTRWLIWKAAMRMALDHPVWGVGLDQFYTQYWPRYVEPAGWPERYTSHAHNIFLDVWLRLGILGLIAAGVIGGFVVQMGTRILGARSSANGLALGAFAVIVTGFVHGMVDNGFFLPDLAVLTWFAIAIIEREAGDAVVDVAPARKA